MFFSLPSLCLELGVRVGLIEQDLLKLIYTFYFGDPVDSFTDDQCIIFTIVLLELYVINF